MGVGGLGSYINQYACAQAWQESSCTSRGVFDKNLHGVLTVTSNPRMSIAIQHQGSGLFKIAVDASPVIGILSNSHYGNLADETVCEIFWDQAGTPTEYHKLAGFGENRVPSAGINLYIEKRGKDGKFYQITDGIVPQSRPVEKGLPPTDPPRRKMGM